MHVSRLLSDPVGSPLGDASVESVSAEMKQLRGVSKRITVILVADTLPTPLERRKARWGMFVARVVALRLRKTACAPV